MSWLIAFIIVLIIILIWWRWWYMSPDRSKRRKAKKYIEQSSGGFDAGARNALNELNAIARPTANDTLMRGTILEYSLLYNGDYNLTRDARTRIGGEILQDYTRVLDNIQEVEDPARTVRQIQEFTLQGGANDLVNIDLNNIIIMLGALNTQTTANTINTRMEEATAATNNIADRNDAYFRRAAEIKSDAQNVHDSKVNADLREVLRIIEESGIRPTSAQIAASFAEVSAYIRKGYREDKQGDLTALNQKTFAAQEVLLRMRGGNYIETYKTTEDYIFAAIWMRANCVENAQNGTLLRVAVVDALASAYEKDAVVCINGRCSDVLNSLTLLDYDARVAVGAKTFEAYRAQIFHEVNELIKAQYAAAAESADARMCAIGKSYSDPSIDLSTCGDLEQQFQNNLADAVTAHIERYSARLSESEMNTMKTECLASLS